MPEIDWEEINTLIHQTKGTLTKIAKAELWLKAIKREASKHLNEIEDIILKQVNGKK